MRTMKNAVEELVIEMDANWMAESNEGYAYGQMVAEPRMLARWAGITEGTSLGDLLKWTPWEWAELRGKDGGVVWYRGIPPMGGPGVVVQVARANPFTQGWMLTELDAA